MAKTPSKTANTQQAAAPAPAPAPTPTPAPAEQQPAPEVEPVGETDTSGNAEATGEDQQSEQSGQSEENQEAPKAEGSEQTNETAEDAGQQSDESQDQSEQNQQEAGGQQQADETIEAPVPAPVVEEVTEPVVEEPAPAPEPVVEAAPATEAVEDQMVVAANEPEEETDEVVLQNVVEAAPAAPDGEHVQTLKIMLAAFAKEVGRHHSSSDDYRAAAKLVGQITKFVIAHPKVDVLDALLAFFEENLDGACRPTEYMKGSTTLAATDEREVGYLYNLFYQLASKQFVRVNHAMIVQVLKKPEISNYFSRRMAGLEMAAKQ